MKPTIILASVFFLALTPALRAEAPVRFIETTGEGEISVAPDQAVIQLGIETSGPVLSQAKDENVRRTKRLIEVLTKLKVPSKNIQTTELRLNPRYEFPNGKRKFIEYTAQKSFRVVIDDLKDYGAVLNGALDAGVGDVNGVQFQSSKQKSLEDDARKAAASDAKKKAETLAAALGQSVGAPIEIRDNPTSGGIRPMAFQQGMVRQAALEDELSPGEITVRSNVSVKFELKSASER